MRGKAKQLLGALGLVCLSSLCWGQGTPLPPAQQQFLDQNGTPLAGGTVLFCVPNTNCGTLKTTYQDAGLTQQNTNPVNLDAGGRAKIFGSGTYEEHVYDVNGVQIFAGVTTAVNGSLLLSVPPKTLLGNPNGSATGAQAVAVVPPLGFGAGGALTVLQSLVADNTNQLVDATYANTQRYTTGTNNITYTLGASSSLYSGFSFSIIANVYVTVQTSGGDTFQPTGSNAISVFPGQNLTLITNGVGQWFLSTSAQVPIGGTIPGQVIQMRGTSCPVGTLAENGQLVSRTTFSLLFASIGTTWGAGDGSTTFALPNAGGQFNRGWEAGQTVDASRAFASPQADALQDHEHTYFQSNNNTVGAGTGGIQANSGGANSATSAIVAPTSGPNSGVAPRVAAETRPVNITVLSCIGTGRLY